MIRKINKKIIKSSLMIAVIFILVMNLFSEDVFAYITSSHIDPYVYVTLKINDDLIKIDTNPYVLNGRVFVPVRFIMESFGIKIQYYNEEKKIVISDKGKLIEIWVFDNKAVINGEREYMDVPVEIINGKVMLPLRFISENVGIDVIWDRNTLSVLLLNKDIDPPEELIFDRDYTDDDLLWLSRIVTIETGWQGFDANLGVANVVLNRVKSAEFPDSIYGVIFDTQYSVQFPPAFYDNFAFLEPTTLSIIAAKMALEGINNIGGSLFFNNVPIRSKSADDLYAIYDGEYFYK
jgi:N-acetylmuramoyl-L-alanine amidase